MLTIGAATLADIYEPHERGTMMGLYYAAPLLGPSLGPILGGALTEAWNWRATFYFLAGFCALSLGSFFLFKDTFRRERSLAYQAALKRAKHSMENKHKRRLAASQTTTMDETCKHNEEPTVVSEKDVEAQNATGVVSTPPPQISVQDVKLSLRDINPLAPIPRVLKQRCNFIILVASGMSYTHSIFYKAN